MQTLISLREANQHLARYIQVVEQGNEIIITRRGKPIAKMVPLKEKVLLTSHQEEIRKKIKLLMNKGSSKITFFDGKSEKSIFSRRGGLRESAGIRVYG